MFGIPYLFSVLGALICDGIRSGGSTCDSNGSWFYVPVLGPFVAAASIPRLESSAVGLFVLDGLLQAGGVAMFIAGLAAKHRVVVVPEEVGYLRSRPRQRAVQWSLVPGAPGAQVGATLALAHF